MDVISLQWDNDNDKAWDVVVRQLARDQLRLKQLEAENAELRGRLFSLTCKECGDNLKSLYCPSCGRPMAQVVGQEYPSYAALRERVKTKCKWIPGEDSFHWEYWNTECGHGFKFEGGGLEDNEFLYCPYCGGPIEVE